MHDTYSTGECQRYRAISDGVTDTGCKREARWRADVQVGSRSNQFLNRSVVFHFQKQEPGMDRVSWSCWSMKRLTKKSKHGWAMQRVSTEVCVSMAVLLIRYFPLLSVYFQSDFQILTGFYRPFKVTSGRSVKFSHTKTIPMSDPQQTQIYNIQKPSTGTTWHIYVTLHKQAIGQPITLDIGDFYFCVRINPLSGAFR